MTYYSELTDSSAVTDATSAAAAAGPVAVTASVNDSDGVHMPSERSEDMPSFDEWKQKEQEKTKNSSGFCLLLLSLIHI